MQIDWLTVGAQWINFLILMWLLRRFLYQPIIRAMDRRQQAIAQRTQDAQQQADQAEQLAQEYRNKLAELEDQRTALLAAVREEAAAERDNLLYQARVESQNLSTRWRQEIQREKTEFQSQLSRELGRLITATARKAVQDLSGQEWEQAVFDHFLTHLQQLPIQDKSRLSASGHEGLVLSSSFELDAAMHSALRETLKNVLIADTGIRFERLPDNQAGLRLSSSGYSVEWTIGQYFAHLDTELEAMLAQSIPIAQSEDEDAAPPNLCLRPSAAAVTVPSSTESRLS